MRKGFYFSFDAFLALLVMSASLAVVAQSSDIASDTFRSSSISYREASTVGQDAMKLASRQTFSSFNDSFRQELKQETVMTSGDMDRTVLDGVSLLWAARNFSYAEKVTERYFDSKLEGYEYRLQVNEDGNRTVIYETSEIPPDAKSVSSISRLVSGHKIDRPSEGFQARARATSVTKNETKIIPVPPLGMAPQNSKMEVRKTFWLNDTEKIYNGTFYISVHYSGASYFEQFKINNKQYGQSKFNWIHEKDSSSGAAAYGTLDVTGPVQEGKNTLFLRMKGGNDYNSHFHPGTKLEIKYRSSETDFRAGDIRHRRINLENIHSFGQGDEAGIFSVKQFTLPEDAKFINATYTVNADELDPECGYSTFWGRAPGWDIEVNLNGDQVFTECGSGKYTKDIELKKSWIENGTNVINTQVEANGDNRWGGNDAVLLGDSSDNSSHIDIWYNVSQDSLRFGEIKVTTSEQVGGPVEEPKTYLKEFSYKDLESTELYIAQLYSTYPEISVDDGMTTETVFDANNPRSAPTNIYIGREYYDVGNQNEILMEDYDGSPERSYLPESAFQWTVWAPSQVGYGDLFENRSAALNDAEQRLEDTLGPFVNATGIETDDVSTGDQPYLWGPASVKLVVWRE